MCGISGLFGKERPDAIEAMTDIIVHRGPDDAGYALFPDAALGHRRLSIVDLSPTGHQPMPTPDQRYWICYNGEVYNAPEIRSELEKLGVAFRGTSDSEVVLQAYATWGADCLHRFNGMFAFLIYDSVQRRVFAARDRFGIKPLYYWFAPNGYVAFASEIKQFTVLPGWNARMNGPRVYDFLAFEALDHTDETLFDGVYQLKGGEYLQASTDELSKGSATIDRWYFLAPKPWSGSFEEAAKQFQDLLRDAVSLRLRADVPVGSCLSGGLDSSAIVCLMHQMLPENSVQKTFSACSFVPAYDERPFIDEVVKQTGVDAHYIYPSQEDLLRTCKQIIWHQDEPFASTSLYAQWKVFELAKPQVKVMLDGQGADEQLAGYSSFYGSYFLELFQSLRWSQLVHELCQAKGSVVGKRPALYLLQELTPPFLRDRIRKALGKTCTAPSWLAAERLSPQMSAPLRPQSVTEQSFLQLTETNLPKLLHWEDRDSMAHSIEARTPFLDYRLVEFVMGLPSSFKLGDGLTKRVMRQAMNGIIPDAIQQRRDKMGFVTPEAHWICKQAPEQFLQLVDAAIEASGGILLPSLRTETEAMIAGKRPFQSCVWRAISFHLWAERFNVQRSETASLSADR